MRYWILPTPFVSMSNRKVYNCRLTLGFAQAFIIKGFSMKTVAVFVLSAFLFWLSSYIVEQRWNRGSDSIDAYVQGSEQESQPSPAVISGLVRKRTVDLAIGYFVSSLVGTLAWGYHMRSRRHARSSRMGFIAFLGLVGVLVLLPFLLSGFVALQFFLTMFAAMAGCGIGTLLGSTAHAKIGAKQTPNAS